MKPTPKNVRIDDQEFVFRAPPHLREAEDWHTAYVPIVDAAFDTVGKRRKRGLLPAYPLIFSVDQHELLFELGSYWEGAIYCLARKLCARDLLQELRALEVRRVEAALSSKEQLFLAIWNSHGQLKWLRAHLIREQLLRDATIAQDSGAQIRRMAMATGNSDLEWLADFVCQHQDEGQRYPNPYFGGTNPLHLGLVDVA